MSDETQYYLRHVGKLHRIFTTHLN